MTGLPEYVSKDVRYATKLQENSHRRGPLADIPWVEVSPSKFVHIDFGPVVPMGITGVLTIILCIS